MVNSVQGVIDVKDLGFTLLHEHVVSVNPSMVQAFSSWFNSQETLSNAVDQLGQARQLGLKTMVDATPINLGRDVGLLKEVSEKTGVLIIPSTGFYFVDEPFMLGWDIDHLAQLMLMEVENGIQGTDIKPGTIKCATETKVTEINERLLRASAKAHVKSGLPVFTHSSSVHKNGLEQQMILLDEGVNPRKLVVGHCGDTTDIEYLESLLEKDSYIGLDRFGLDVLLPMKERIDVCVELIEKGYIDQLTLSHDYTVFIDWWPRDVLPEFKGRNPRWGFQHIFTDIIPPLKERGVTEKQINQMLVLNPKQILG